MGLSGNRVWRGLLRLCVVKKFASCSLTNFPISSARIGTFNKSKVLGFIRKNISAMQNNNGCLPL